MSIAVTCASTRLGRGVAQALRARGPGTGLVLADAQPHRLEAELRAAGEVRHADFDDPLTLGSAFAGVLTLLLFGGAERGLHTGQAPQVIAAARAAGVERLVLVSSIDPRPGNPALCARDDRALEGMARSSGLGWTILRLQEVLDDFLAEGLGQQAGGRMFTNRGGGLSAPIALADAAAAIAASLADPAQAGRTCDLTGPSLVAVGDLAAGLGIAHVTHKDAKYLDQLLADGLAPRAAEARVALGRAVREGYYAVASGDVLRLIGKAPRGLGEMLKG